MFSTLYSKKTTFVGDSSNTCLLGDPVNGRFLRGVIDNQLYYAKSYKKVFKRNSYTVQFEELYGEILGFELVGGACFILLVQLFPVEFDLCQDKLTGLKLEHIRVLQRQGGNVIKKLVSRNIQKVVAIDTREGVMAIALPNLVESD